MWPLDFEKGTRNVSPIAQNRVCIASSLSSSWIVHLLGAGECCKEEHFVSNSEWAFRRNRELPVIIRITMLVSATSQNNDKSVSVFLKKCQLLQCTMFYAKNDSIEMHCSHIDDVCHHLMLSHSKLWVKRRTYLPIVVEECKLIRENVKVFSCIP